MHAQADRLAGGKRRCLAINHHTGEQCKRRPIIGGTLCPVHGGSSPQTKQAAYKFLLTLVEPALSTLYDALGTDCNFTTMEGVTLCDVHGSKCPEWAARVNAAKALLDRAGFGPHSTVSVGENNDLSDVPTEELASRLEALAVAARTEATRKKEELMGNPIADAPGATVN